MNYVSDTVAAFLGVGAADGVEGELYNVGSGVGGRSPRCWRDPARRGSREAGGQAEAG